MSGFCLIHAGHGGGRKILLLVLVQAERGVFANDPSPASQSVDRAAWTHLEFVSLRWGDLISNGVRRAFTGNFKYNVFMFAKNESSVPALADTEPAAPALRPPYVE